MSEAAPEETPQTDTPPAEPEAPVETDTPNGDDAPAPAEGDE
jgi:hypothetical protein